MESYGITNTSCKSTVLKKSSNNWLNSAKPLTQQLKGAIFAVFPAAEQSHYFVIMLGNRKWYKKPEWQIIAASPITI